VDTTFAAPFKHKTVPHLSWNGFYHTKFLFWIILTCWSNNYKVLVFSISLPA
jgi:hypothetical protein